MRSLRLKLLLGTTIGTAAVLIGAGVALYALISRTLRADFDSALAAKARALAALVEHDEDGLEHELSAVALPEFAAGDRPEYYELWLPDSTVFARSPSLPGSDLPILARTSAPMQLRTIALPDGRAGRLVQLEFQPRRESSSRGGSTTVTIAVARDTAGLDATLSDLRGLMAITGLVAVGLSIAVLIWLVDRSLRPVAHLGRRIAEVGETDLSRRISVPALPSELRPVVDRMNELLGRLEAAFARERRFTGDVAHELRTPLAGLRSKLELALTRDRSADSYRCTIRDSLGVNRQMERLVENLLQLARADAGQLHIRLEAVDVAGLARECWRDLESRAKSRGLTDKWNCAGPTQAMSDADLLRLVLHNVLENATTYAEAESPVRISVAGGPGAVTVTVSNRSALPAAEAQHVFDRFWRADPARERREEVRCGLGLPLCKIIIERLGGKITATVGENSFGITVQLPPAGEAIGRPAPNVPAVRVQG